jgi:thiol:disulfide interchange protein DsbC
MKLLSKTKLLLIGSISLLSFTVAAEKAQNNFEALEKKIETTLQMEVESIGDSPVTGLLQVLTARGLFYTSLDGNYFLQANIYNLDEDMRNETDAAMSGLRIEGLEKFTDSVIEFKAKDEKYVVNVFTDITCGYCRKLHNEMSQYNDLGITVRYLAFPRAGINSQPYNDMVSVWCADDPQKAMTDAKNGTQIPNKSCSTKVAEQYTFGQKIGVQGTPNIVMPDGSVVPGYQPAPVLAQALQAAL